MKISQKCLRKRKAQRNAPGQRVMLEKDKSKKKEPEEEEKEQKTPTEKKKKEPKSAEKKEKEPKTHYFHKERPIRERKSVERLVATIEKDSAREFHIEKGRGTALKDIPNGTVSSNSVALYLVHILHMDIQPLPCNVQWAAQVKSNISRFSGFVWHDNEVSKNLTEKQMIKVKEKLDKCVKEKLVEFCDVLDIPISKANTRKEDIIAKLIEFLVEPHATTSDLIAEKEQKRYMHGCPQPPSQDTATLAKACVESFVAVLAFSAVVKNSQFRGSKYLLLQVTSRGWGVVHVFLAPPDINTEGME
ncbi:UNVERIFIED_CONTAM: hypothetical protein Sradi_5349500 [Sesamum radiatum]|uniref:DEK domain-containing chromatin associated protein n=1 Tax=Sesamum radiatum TaxID=300843 RepID=A0AAW2LNX2_SESRA